MVTYKKLLEMLDSVEKTEDGKKYKNKIKRLKEQTTELIEDQDTEGKGPVGKKFKEIKKRSNLEKLKMSKIKERPGAVGSGIGMGPVKQQPAYMAKGGEVKKYMGGGSVHKKKNKMLTTKGWGASRKT